MHKHKIKPENKNLLQPISTFSNNMETQKHLTPLVKRNILKLNLAIFINENQQINLFLFLSLFFNDFIFSSILNI
jgi:hypothetical protein